MISMHLPVYLLMLLLGTALIIPLAEKLTNLEIKIYLSYSLAIASLFSVSSLVRVLQHGAYAYHFGQWHPSIGVEFLVDEFSAAMTVLVMILSTLVIVYSFRDVEHEIQPDLVSGYYVLIFLMLFSMVGMILTNDLFNLYVFMEILSLTSCGIVSIKRKKENLMASLKYLMLGTIGSVSILLGIAFLYMVTGTLNMTLNYDLIQAAWQIYPRNILVALGFILTGFGIKAAVFPLHTWLPDAHSTAPTPSSALLSGLVVKIYLFGAIKMLFRVIGMDIITQVDIPLFMTYFAMVGMIMGSVFAIGQKDIKRILAYSSVAQIGYIVLGIGLATESGLSVALFHVVTHALMKSALFLSAGAVIYQTGRRDVRELEGIGYQMPITMSVFTIGALGMIGIPGINGFMSKWYLSFAVLEAGRPLVLLVILLSSFLNAVYYLPIIISAFLREREDHKNVLIKDDLPLTMTGPMVIIAGLCILFGFFPQLVMNIIQQAMQTFM
ncbi:complex I subunit 5 family protein [Anoxynatronum buryatiense]|uniref:Multisubunit sodium/proton antiporter, MrpD subunit n=1 Tax=Anoxynatronum buryatiense TaxID=489973 RepID=A0AA45WU17_9CLOT|nr:monovalent cation/H+ antiporter subunit D family protein [Anoxynatronum buryatiense]SMP45141.1 multisubunit sodium/proton antiporter, MrpD subunit [Anoxynatronum buryatiense]